MIVGAELARLLPMQAASRRGQGRTDRTDIPFVTVDPASSRDLDQALSLHRRVGGYRVFYAVADVLPFVPAGGELEAEIWRPGETVYLPDGNVPLHPVSLSEDAASLLPDRVRPAVLWSIGLDVEGAVSTVHVERAVVRSRAKLDYAGVQAAADAARLDRLAEPIVLLPELGRLLQARALDRGAVNLPIPEQELELDADNGWRLALRASTPVEEWNAQISLLTGMVAADIMVAGRIGLLRTMPDPDDRALAALRAAAAPLGVEWPDQVSLGAVVAARNPGSPRGAAFIDQAAEVMRGASYTAFDGEVPEYPRHGAVAAAYAHVTAPLRRLADRYATEVCLSLVAGREVPEQVRAALPDLPRAMGAGARRASAAARGAVDLAEAVPLADRIGEEFDAAVLDVDRRDPVGSEITTGVVALDQPAVRARCRGRLALGERVRVRLVAADPRRRRVRFETV